MNKYLPLIFLVCALAGGIFAWWIDSQNDEPQAAVLVILAVTFLLGMAEPRKAWLWAIIVGACLPIGYLLAQIGGITFATPVEPGWYAASLAFIPAFIGAYVGALGRGLINATVSKP